MRKLKRRAFLFALALSVPIAAGLILATEHPSESAQPLPPMLTAEELKQFEILQAADVTGNAAAVSPAPAISYDQAIAIAAKHLGRATTNVRVLHGSAKPIHDQAARSVWIVMFAGGTVPALGPKNSHTPRPMRFAAVEVDDATGEVPTWFMS